MIHRRRLTDDERRARLIARHHLAGTARDVVDAVRGVVALHSSDPLTPYLGARARVPGFVNEDLDTALYDARTLWRLHAMRRTLFVVPTDERHIFDAAVGRDIARRERRRIEKLLAAELALEAEHVTTWLRTVEMRTLEVLADGRERRTSELADAVPGLETEITVGSGKWSTRSRLSSRLLFLLAMEGHLVRARPAGTWRSSQYHWAAVPSWFEGERITTEATAGRAALAHQYLAAYGPVTTADVRWWTGWSAKQAAAALDAVDAVAVKLESGETGFVLPDDLDPVVAASHVTFLPGLDSTPMGWRQRGFYLGDHGKLLFDRNGNVGPTVWADGRIVGGWTQHPEGEVVFRLLEDLGADAARRVAAEAVSLTAWFDGPVAIPRFRTPLERELAG